MVMMMTMICVSFTGRDHDQQMILSHDMQCEENITSVTSTTQIMMIVFTFNPDALLCFLHSENTFELFVGIQIVISSSSFAFSSFSKSCYFLSPTD
jgi:hypothetical protein